MELDEFQIRQRGPSILRQHKPVPNGARRVGGVQKQPANPARGQQHAVTRQRHGLITTGRQHTAHACIIQQNPPRHGIHHRNAGCGAHALNQCAHNFRARLVAIGVQNPRPAMRRLQPQSQRAVLALIEPHAQTQQRVHQLRPGAYNALHRSALAQPRARRQRIGNMQGHIVIRANRSG